MSNLLNDFIRETDDEWPDAHYGTGFRCSVDLKDKTHLPCVMLRRPNTMVNLALRRFKNEKQGRSVFAKNKGNYEKVVEQFVTSGNRINSNDIRNVSHSHFALPLTLLRKIKSETVMSWTGWVFEMSDGKLFPYGSTFLFEFFQLPEGYRFSDVVEVHNHSYLDETGTIKLIRENMDEMIKYRGSNASVPLYRERPYFECFVKEK